MKKERLDQLLVKQNYFSDIDLARRAIMAGLVKVDHEVISMVGLKIDPTSSIAVKQQTHPYVSRGGLKLEKAIRVFDLDLTGRIMVDIGASTGGFTDCALRHHAAHVYAIDVGYGQLAWKLRQDPRVTVLERTNFRYVSADAWDNGQPDMATIDVSFISLRVIFEKLHQLLSDQAEVIALIKPQFEAGRNQVGNKGIVKDPLVHQQVIQQTSETAAIHGLELKGLSYSPIQGSAGNIEFLAHLMHHSTSQQYDRLKWDDLIQKIVREAHQTMEKPKRSET